MVPAVAPMLSSFLYGSLASGWLATARLRASALSGINLAIAIALHAALQFLVSLLLSVVLYHALYNSLVPDEVRTHEAYFDACDTPALLPPPLDEPRSAPPGLDLGHRRLARREAAADAPLPPPPRRLAELWFDTQDATVAPAYIERSRKLLPPLAPGW
eukprot:4221742-Prymnesium_polylepis.1